MTIRTVVDRGPGELTWIDVVEPTPTELEQVAARWGLHPVSVRDCLDPEHLPKFERFPSRTFIIIRVFDAEATAECATVAELTRKVALFAGPDFLVTIHRKELPFLAALRERFENCPPGNGSGREGAQQALLCEVIERGVATFESPLERVEEGIDEFEAALFESRHEPDDLLHLYVLRRRATLIKRMLWRTLEVVQRMSPPGEPPTPLLQDLKEHVESLHFYADELTDYATNLTSLQLGIASQKTNQVMRVLTVFSAFFLPLTFIVGVYGMNFEFMPELHTRWGYPAILAAMLLVTVGIGLWFRRRGWLRP